MASQCERESQAHHARRASAGDRQGLASQWRTDRRGERQKRERCCCVARTESLRCVRQSLCGRTNKTQRDGPCARQLVLVLVHWVYSARSPRCTRAHSLSWPSFCLVVVVPAAAASLLLFQSFCVCAIKNRFLRATSHGRGAGSSRDGAKRLVCC